MSHNLKGTYVFKQNGIEVGRSENIVTESGKTMILQYLCGARQEWAVDMSIGALQSTPTAIDKELEFELGRYPIVFKSFIKGGQNDPNMIVVRSTIPESLYANIYEIGIYGSTNSTNISNRNNQILTDFSDVSDWTINQGVVDIIEFVPQAIQSPRIGKYSVMLQPETVFTSPLKAIQFDGYSEVDTIDMLVYNTVPGVVLVYLEEIDGTQIALSLITTENTGYQKLSMQLPSSIRNFSTIKTISIHTDFEASLTIDAIKVSNSAELSTENYLVSKSSIDSPIAKFYGVPLDVEYYLELV